MNDSLIKSKGRYVNIGVIAFVILLLISLVYFLFGMRKAGQGPEIFINAPAEGVVVDSPVIELEGRVSNVAKMEINGSDVSVRDGSLIKEQLILQPGENEFDLKATDQFGNSSEKTIKIIYKSTQNDS